MRSNSILLLTLTASFALTLVVACGPTKERTSITRAEPTAAELALNVCKDTLRSSHALAVGKDLAPVSLCQKTQDPDIAGSTRLSLVPVTVGYRLSKADTFDQSPVISLRIGLQGASEKLNLSKTDQAYFRTIFANECLAATSDIFGRSRVGTFGAVKLSSDADFIEADDTANSRAGGPNSASRFDQILRIKRGEDGADSYFTLESSVEANRFYVSGRGVESNACRAARAVGSATFETKRLCQKAVEARKLANAPFCREVAVMIGAWLGLASLEKEQAKCGVRPPKPALKVAASSFVQAADTTSAVEYFSTAKLNREDVIKVLQPGCSSLDRFAPKQVTKP